MGKIILFTIGLCCFLACSSNDKSAPIKASKTQVDKSSNIEDYFSHKVAPEYARHFSVSYHGNYKLVKTNAAFYPDGVDQQEKIEQDVLVLVQKGTDPPVLDAELADATVIEVPIGTVAVNVQHSESFLRELGLVDHIAAIGGLYSYNDEIRNKAASGDLGQIGYSWHSPPNIEVLLERKPELFLMTMASLDHKTSLDKCRQLGISTAAVFDWSENEYLARAEWIKFYSLFFNAEQQANEKFEEIEENIASLKAVVDDRKKQSAIWGYYTGKQRWVMQINSFQGQYMEDAGLINALLTKAKPNANGTQTLTTEELLTHGKDCDHWFIGDIHASPLPKERVMSSFKSWRTGDLYHNMVRVKPKVNTSDWYAKAIVRPDIVLKDVVKLVHTDLLDDHQLMFLGTYDKSSQTL